MPHNFSRTLGQGRIWWALSLVAIVSCNAPDDSPIGTRSQAITTQNGVWSNGLSTNGVWSNGVWSNGVWSNGLSTNGVWSNGVWSNGVWSNGVWSNGVWSNGVWSNGVWSNGVWSNGVWSNGVAATSLKSNQYARQVLQYIYSCAMPVEDYDTAVDPNGGTLACSGDGVCDPGYECQEGHCVVPLRGAIGIGINQDGTGWWEAGRCDETCQRWVSACVLARTNAYGVKVPISMRVHATAPAAVRAALATTPAEEAAFPLPEGSYYGNMFATTPGIIDSNGAFVPTTAPSPTGVYPEGGPVMSTPTFNACAGPASNVPELTRRFVSSQGDQSAIPVHGACSDVCAGADAKGARYGCADGEGRVYDEVISISLSEPIAFCGNGVCEDREVVIAGGVIVPAAEDETSCPDDCHPGTWAKDYTSGYGFGTKALTADAATSEWVAQGMAAVSPKDASVVVIGNSPTVELDATKMISGSVGTSVLAKFDKTGKLLWWRKVRLFGQLAAGDQTRAVLTGVTVDVAGEISVLGSGLWSIGPMNSPYDSQYVGQAVSTAYWVNRYSSSGALLAGEDVPQVFAPKGTYCGQYVAANGSVASMCGSATLAPSRLIQAYGTKGNVVIAASYGEPMRTGPTSGKNGPPLELSTLSGQNLFVAQVTKIGRVEWAKTLAGGVPSALDIDSQENVLVVTAAQGLVKLDGKKQTVLWTKATAPFTTLAVDSQGSVYAGGHFENGQNFGSGPLSVAGRLPFLMKLSSSGTPQWTKVGTAVCPGGSAQCSSALTRGVSVDVGPDGNVLYVVFGKGPLGGGLDFGKGILATYSSNNTFLASYKANGTLNWSTKVSTVLTSNLLGAAVGSAGDIVLAGNFSGSLLVDGRLLVTSAPDSAAVLNAYMATIGAPGTVSSAPPKLGGVHPGETETGTTLPANLLLPATDARGAFVYYVQPTALDADGDGSSVFCTPGPNQWFPLGQTVVTCTASDPQGSSDSASFTVTVADLTGPVLLDVPAPPPVEATSPAGAVVTFTLPTARDQVDGPVPVSCNKPSGSNFALGTTPVTCTSSDAAGNVSTATFDVNVIDTTPPVLIVPGPITLPATSSSGASVTYVATATDIVDPSVPVACQLPSGTTFPIGSSTVTCTATDDSGNSASGSFVVTVKMAFSCSGFSSPSSDSSCGVGKTLPVKFVLTGVPSGVTIPATLSLKSPTGKVTVVASGTTPWTTVRQGTTVTYSLNVSTSGLSPGKWQLVLDLGDGISRTVTFTIVK
jgi:hypothetical protein